MLYYSSYYTYTHDATTAIVIINKYIADIQNISNVLVDYIQTNVMTGDKPLEFWLNSCSKSRQPAISFGC